MQTLISTDGEVMVKNGNITANDNNVIDRIDVQSIRIYTAKGLQVTKGTGMT